MDTQGMINPISEQEPDLHQPIVRSFPAPETNLARIFSDPQFRRAFYAQLKRYNRVWIVRFVEKGRRVS